MTAARYPLEPFEIAYTVVVRLEGMERLPDESEDEARKSIGREILAEIRRVKPSWGEVEVVDWTIEVPDSDGETRARQNEAEFGKHVYG